MTVCLHIDCWCQVFLQNKEEFPATNSNAIIQEAKNVL